MRTRGEHGAVNNADGKIFVVGTNQAALGTASLMFQNAEFRRLSSHC